MHLFPPLRLFLFLRASFVRSPHVTLDHQTHRCLECLERLFQCFNLSASFRFFPIVFNCSPYTPGQEFCGVYTGVLSF